LNNAEKSVLFQKWTSDQYNNKTTTTLDDSVNSMTTVALLKVAILWSKPTVDNVNSNCRIVVRGHACCSNNLTSISTKVKPIVCSIAAKYTSMHHLRDNDDNDDIQHDNNIKSLTINTTMPTQVHNPNRKIASWTRQRKQITKQLINKNDQQIVVDEVLLLKPYDIDPTELELLEGGSSNLFVST
jgi:hypothetical protein